MASELGFWRWLRPPKDVDAANPMILVQAGLQLGQIDLDIVLADVLIQRTNRIVHRLHGLSNVIHRNTLFLIDKYVPRQSEIKFTAVRRIVHLIHMTQRVAPRAIEVPDSIG